MRGVEIPAIDDVQRPRTDDAADEDPGRERLELRHGKALAAGLAEGEPHADADRERDEKTVPAKRERTEVDEDWIDVDGHDYTNASAASETSAVVSPSTSLSEARLCSCQRVSDRIAAGVAAAASRAMSGTMKARL